MQLLPLVVDILLQPLVWKFFLFGCVSLFLSFSRVKKIPAQIGRHVLDDDDGKLLFLNVFLYEVGSVSNEVFLYVFYYAAIQHT